jgi:recombination protein RecR
MKNEEGRMKNFPRHRRRFQSKAEFLHSSFIILHSPFMLPEPIVALTAALAKLPGVGPRSAERMALHLVQAEPAQVQHLAETILPPASASASATPAARSRRNPPAPPAPIDRRDAALVCVVERAVDILSIEKSGTYRGKFHVLGGKISPLDGVEPDDLRIAELEKRLASEPIKEIIIALGTDVEGDATSIIWRSGWRAPGLKISRIGFGLPAGSGLEFADELTLNRALEGRREMNS